MPEFASYAPKLWRYWADHLDPDRARRDDPAGPLVGKHVIITGASSGIGRASAIAVAERGATVFALARNAEALDDLIAEIRAAGGQAHAFTCDVTDSTSVEHTVKDILGRFGHVDYLVNNAGRSIRRSVIASTDRLHDYERVMAVNYFGAVRMVLALLPHWRERRFGHVVNVSSAGVQANGPKYSAYLPSKAALDAFADVVSTETLSDHITFTNIHMPLVKTPMIVPSRRLNPMPPISPEHAAAMVVRGLVEKPARIDTPVGTLADFGNYMTPKLSRRILHQLYLGYPDSAAARESAAAEPSTSWCAVATAQAPDAGGLVDAHAAARSKTDQASRATGARRALVTALGRRGGLPQAHDVALGVLEVSGEAHFTDGHLLAHRLAAQRLDLRERVIDAVHVDRDHRALRKGGFAFEHASADVSRFGGHSRLGGWPGRDDRVLHFRHLVELPTEDLLVEVLSPLTVTERHLEMHHTTSHFRLLAERFE